MSEPAVTTTEPTTALATPAPEPVSALAEPTAAPVSEPASTGNWRDSLSPDLRNNPTLEHHESVESVAKELVNVQKLIGADKIVIPGEDASPEEWDSFHTKLGRPADPANYDLEALEVPEGMPWDGEFQTSMVGTMHKLGLNQKQVQGVLGAYIESIGGQYQQATGDTARARETGINDLRNEWGKSFDSQVDLATRAFRAGAGENFEAVADIQLVGGGKLGDHPDVIKAFAQLGGKMSEHGLVGATASRSTLSPTEAGGERNKLMADQDFLKAYLDGGHLEHAAAVKRINDLTIAEVGEE